MAEVWELHNVVIETDSQFLATFWRTREETRAETAGILKDIQELSSAF